LRPATIFTKVRFFKINVVFYKDNMLAIAYIKSNLVDLEVQGKKTKSINNEKIF